MSDGPFDTPGDPPDGPPDDPGGDTPELVAGEYVLGLLTASEAEAVRQRWSDDPSFVNAVRYWEDRFAGIALSARPIAPRALVKARIDRTLFDDPKSAKARPMTRLWRSLAFWRLAAGAFTILTAFLTGALLLAPPLTRTAPAEETDQYIVALTSDTGGAPVIIQIEVAGDASTSGDIAVLPFEVTDLNDRSPELWVIPQGGAPISLGLLATDATTRLQIAAADLAAITANSSLAISLEPPGGSPTGQPTGPIIGIGQLRRL